MSDSRGPWVHLIERLRRRKLAVAAFSALALIITSAIYAPIIANDRPYVMEAIDYGAYESARETLVTLAGEFELGLRVPQGESAKWSKLPLPPELVSRARERQHGIHVRLESMRRCLADGVADERLAQLDEIVEQTMQVGVRSDRVSAAAIATAVVKQAEQIRSDFAARDPRRPGSQGRELAALTSHPLFEALSQLDVFAMAVWPWLLVIAVRALRRRSLRNVALFGCAMSLMIAYSWSKVFPPGPSLSNSPKAGIESGDIVVKSAVFPPLAVGFAETNMTEVFRPPTWTDAAEIDEQGRYVRGARRPVEDPATGFTPAATPVEVRAGECTRNCKWRHALGTDSLGRDLLARLLWGARTTLAVAFAAAALLVVIGVVIGSIAGWFGGWIDIALSRAIEVVQAFPALFLIVVVAATLSARSQGLGVMVAVVALVGWTGVARLVRAEFLRLKNLEFVLAARALGFGHLRIIVRHVLPNALGPVLVSAAFLVGWSMFVESAVSFLGFGVQQPQPSWGALIQESRAPEHWWILVFPGSAIALTVFCFHALGEALRDALDPRLGA